jgi:hypothetical protein
VGSTLRAWQASAPSLAGGYRRRPTVELPGRDKETGRESYEQYEGGWLTQREIKDISVMLNFDMVSSPKFVRFVYEGDGSGTGTVGPNGSDVIEDVFLHSSPPSHAHLAERRGPGATQADQAALRS